MKDYVGKGALQKALSIVKSQLSKKQDSIAGGGVSDIVGFDSNGDVTVKTLESMKDKSGCLPLSGGTMTGNVNLAPASRIISSTANNDILTITAATNNRASIGFSSGTTGISPVNEKKIRGVADPTSENDVANKRYVDTNRSNPNLLDNWYFADPINQRNIQKDVYWGANTYGIDRWKATNKDTLKLTDGGIAFSRHSINPAYLVQPFESIDLRGTTVTASIIADGVLLTGTVNINISGSLSMFGNTNSVNGKRFYFTIEYESSNNYWVFTIVRPGNSSSDTGSEDGVVSAVKLELGSQQTLAHQDASGNWILNDPPPNRATELAKCQRYQYLGRWMGVSHLSVNNDVYVIVSLPVSLRKTPALVGTPTVRNVSGNNVNSAGVTIQSVYGNIVELKVTGAGQDVYVYSEFDGIGFDANL